MASRTLEPTVYTFRDGSCLKKSMDPITDICVVEEAKNAPPGYSVIELTGDAGQDADLWKDKGLFFGRKETRYLCFARKFSLDCVESLSVQLTPPPNVLTITSTRDTGQKCLRKRHLCYTVIGRDISSSVISEIGVFSKTAPEGFTIAGELNGLVIAYNTIKINVEANGSIKNGTCSTRQKTKTDVPATGEIGALNGLGPKNWIDDIPYRLSPLLQPISRLPAIHLKTASQIYSQFNYDFSLEREVLRTTSSPDFSNEISSREEFKGIFGNAEAAASVRDCTGAS